MTNYYSTLETVKRVYAHPNADSIEFIDVSGYSCIVQKDSFSVGDRVVLIQPDTVLPEDAEWAAPYKTKSSRVRAIKLRGEWSFGLTLDPKVFFSSPDQYLHIADGTEISEITKVTKYCPPEPQNIDAAGYLPPSMPRTDENRYQNFSEEMLPFGKLVDVTLKIDGSSATYFCIYNKMSKEWDLGSCSRSLRIKPESHNHYTAMNTKYDILVKLKEYCINHNVSLAIRGEIYGNGIQGHTANPHANCQTNFAAYSVWNHDKLKYEGPDDAHYYTKVCDELDIPVVPMLENQVELTPQLLHKYSSELSRLDGHMFEGVVVKYGKGESFKIINLHYDQRK